MPSYSPPPAVPAGAASAVAGEVTLRGGGIAVELIEKRICPLPQFDAPFIRETTATTHHTFRFAKKAAAEGMAVIDDPTSVLRCTNKAFLVDLLRGNGVPTPATCLPPGAAPLISPAM